MLKMLVGLSADQLEALSAEERSLAEDLCGKEPTVALALRAGVRDLSYTTVRNGWVISYEGEAIIVMADGSRWRAIGHRSTGSAEFLRRGGWIEFQLLER